MVLAPIGSARVGRAMYPGLWQPDTSRLRGKVCVCVGGGGVIPSLQEAAVGAPTQHPGPSPSEEGSVGEWRGNVTWLQG